MRKTSQSLLAVIFFLVPLAAGVAAGQQPAPSKGRLGNFSLEYGVATSDWGDKEIQIRITGLTGRPAVAKTSDYEMAAPRIDLTLQRMAASNSKPKTTSSQIKATRGVATGGARIIVREPDQQRVTTITCDKAVYTATLTPGDRGKIVMTGNVHSVTTDPGFAEPFVSDSASSEIEFLSDGRLRTYFNGGANGGTIHGAIKEPAPKAKPGP